MENKMKICILLLASFCKGVEMCSSRKISHGAPEPPPMPTLSCDAFPGSDEWNACLSKWNAGVADWKKQVAIYSQEQTYASPEDANDGATSSMALNGWKIRAKDCGVSSSNINGQLTLDVRMPNVDEVKDELIYKSTSTKRWSGYKGGKLQSWIKVTPPSGVSIDDVKHSFADHVLKIRGPDSGRG